MTAMLNTTIAHYKITAKLGQGGMGEVYRATDTKLGREVAIKVLPEEFARNKERLARFEREAKALAQLNHPHIAAVHGFDQSDRQWFLAMELVEGEDLSKRLKRGAMPVEEALDVCKQIAEALEAAHEKGIIHRDLKPANVKLTEDGQIKVLDFGLAKTAVADATSSNNADSMSPTITADYTMPGTLLGTAAYMSPEQARGKPVDKRSDIWSFGCVLYECLTGKRMFQGEDTTDTLATIIKGEPDWSALPENTPPTIHLLLRKCLAKDRKRRLPDIAAARIDLEEMDDDPSNSMLGTQKQVSLKSDRQPTLFLIGALVGAVVASAMFVWLGGELPESKLPLKSSLVFEKGAGPAKGTGRNLALSPDGTRLAYFTSSAFDGGRLWIRDLTDGSSKPLDGTEGAARPFWKPDGTMLGYFAEQELRVVPAEDGPSRFLSRAPDPNGGTWNDQNMILYNPSGGALFQIPSAGGTSQRVTRPSYQGEEHRSPVFLPDGRHFLFWSIDFRMPKGEFIYLGDLETGLFKRVKEGADPVYVASGLLVYRYYYSPSSLFAQRFDPEQGKLSGQPMPILRNIGIGEGGNTMISVNSRTLVAGGLEDDHKFTVLIDRNSDELKHLENRRGFIPRFSPDGEHVAFGGEKLWLHGLERDVSVPIPTQARWIIEFAWSHDSSRIVYVASRVMGQLRVVYVNGSGKEENLFQSKEGEMKSPEWSPDDQTILFVYDSGPSRASRELWAFDVAKKESSPLLAEAFDVFEARFAPNGQWYAYSSNEGDSVSDVYIRPFPGPGKPIRVSAEGGARPRWRRDGTELFYVNGAGHLVAVPIKFEDEISLSKEKVLSAAPIISDPYGKYPTFDVHPEGQRYLLLDQRVRPQLTILRDWEQMLDGRK
jgi:eukaryotic-like serine/threonine-protein kinase